MLLNRSKENKIEELRIEISLFSTLAGKTVGVYVRIHKVNVLIGH